MREGVIRPKGYLEGMQREWLVANGLGGYASSTAVGANTRAYHGLLVAALSPPTGRRLLLSSLDEELNGCLLSNHQYPGTIHPQGFRHLREFAQDPLPRFSFQAGDARVKKTVFMLHKENTTVVLYRVSGASGVMRVIPLVHDRSFHASSPPPDMRQEPLENGVILSSGLRLLSEARYVRNELRYYNLEYELERERGLAWREDCLSPGHFEMELDGDVSFAVAASTWRSAMPDAQEALRREDSRLKNLKAPIPGLAQAADSFLVQRGKGRSIIAGYHWFDDWGRDAMISLPGLLLVTGRFDEARDVLLTFARAMKGGLLPNDLGAGSYNTVDASLWFFRAAFKYHMYTGDRELIRQLWPSLEIVIDHYSAAADGDLLIPAGPALTWMDARVDGQPVTPREGKACEINALWYDALRMMEPLAQAAGMGWDASLAGRVKRSYRRFWNAGAGCLYDVIDPHDPSIRPNQVIAAAVPGLLSQARRRSIVEVVSRELLTPYGLRTLSPKDSGYTGRYEGGPAQRDRAYHQGTVWPWLLGPYITAFLSANKRSRRSRERAKELLRPLLDLNIYGMSTIPEVFDGDGPQRPKGCISQAWSVAEVMRAWHEEVMGED
jgi:predicted glycogen debranching enzyme